LQRFLIQATINLMPLRTKTFTLILFLCVSTIASIFLISEIILIANFNRVEEDKLKLNIARTVSGVDDDLTSLSTLVSDYSNWDDTYKFIKDKNSAYIRSNLVDQTFINTRNDFIIFIDETGKLVYSGVYDFDTQSRSTLPVEFSSFLKPDSLLLQHPDLKQSYDGIILLPKGPVFVSSHAILTSSGEGPSRGSVIMGYYLSSKRLQDLRESVKLPVEIYKANSLPADLQQLLPEISSSKDALITKIQDTRLVNGYALVRDIYGNNAFVIKVPMPREIYQQGLASMWYMIYALIMVGILSLVFGIGFLEIYIVRPIKKLITEVTKVETSGDLSSRISTQGKDEIASLASSINKMLDTLENSEVILREVNAVLGQKASELEKKTGELEKMNSFMIGRELKMAELKKEIEGLKKRQHAV
jgi:adenylate cyclase